MGFAVDLSYMVQDAAAFNLDLSHWNVSSLKYIQVMSCCSPLFHGNLSGWKTAATTNISSAFYLASNFNQDLSSWDVSQVQDLHLTFLGASYFQWKSFHLEYLIYDQHLQLIYAGNAFTQDLSSWDVHQVEDMTSMFYGAHSFNSYLSLWNVQSSCKEKITCLLVLSHSIKIYVHG